MNNEDQNDSSMFTREMFPALAEEQRLEKEASVTRLLHFQRMLGAALIYGAGAALAATLALMIWNS